MAKKRTITFQIEVIETQERIDDVDYNLELGAISLDVEFTGKIQAGVLLHEAIHQIEQNLHRCITGKIIDTTIAD